MLQAVAVVHPLAAIQAGEQPAQRENDLILCLMLAEAPHSFVAVLESAVAFAILTVPFWPGALLLVRPGEDSFEDSLPTNK